MRSAAAVVAERGADLIDLNMGCPVPKVMKTGAGAALIRDPDTAVAVARAARRGVRAARHRQAARRARARRREGFEVARRLVEDAGRRRRSTFHPRSAAVRHKGMPDYELAARLVDELPVPVIVSGGMEGAEHIRGRVRAHRLRGGDAGARRPRQPVAVRAGPRHARRGARAATRSSPSGSGSMDRAVEHLGPERAARYLRKFHPWYVERARRRQGRAGRAPAGGHDRGAARRDRRRWRRPSPPETAATMTRRSARHSAGLAHSRTHFPKDRRMQKDVILTPEGLEKLKQEIEYLSERPSAARSRSASRKPASSATSPRTPSTTTPRTSRRCSRRASRSSRRSCARRRSSTPPSSTPTSSASARWSTSRTRSRQGGRVHDRRLDRGRTRRASASPTSRRSARRCSAARRATPSSVPAPQGPTRKLKITKIDVGLVTRPRRTSPRSCSHAAAQARARCAPRASTRSRTPIRAWSRSRRSRPRTRSSPPGRRPTCAPASPAASPPAAARARRRSSTSSTAAGGCSCTRASTCSARSAMERLLALDLGDLIGVDGHRLPHPPRRALAARRRLRAAGQVAAPAAGQAPRPRRRRDPLPPPRARPDRQRGGARAVHHPRAR